MDELVSIYVQFICNTEVIYMTEQNEQSNIKGAGRGPKAELPKYNVSNPMTEMYTLSASMQYQIPTGP